MRKSRVVVLALFALCCKQHKQTLNEQLHNTFSIHLKQIDSLASLDSTHILWNIAVTQRLGRIFDDSIYVREFTRVKSQLANAKQKNISDSVEFYQYEINFMEKQIDSVTKSISEGDTTKRYGYLVGCAYYISKNGRTKMDSAMLFIDSTSTIRYTEFLDSALTRTVKTFK